MIEFDPGPSKALARHLANAPEYTAAQRKLLWHPEDLTSVTAAAAAVVAERTGSSGH